jgi:O-acetyl-ADP-ribose deacetylase (regulator of RNase III)
MDSSITAQSSDGRARARYYQFGRSKLTICFGDIVVTGAQVIVSSDDCYITMGGGVSAAILRAGGGAIPLDAAKKVPAALGDVVVTTAGTLTAQYVFHAITIGPNPENLSPGAIVERATRRCMRLLDGLHLSSIAFPAIGAGIAGFSYEDVAARMAEVIAEELSTRAGAVDVAIFLFDRFEYMTEMDFVRFFEEFAARAPRVVKKVTTASWPSSTPQPSFIDLAAETQEEYKRRRIHNLRRLFAELEDQRGNLENKLIGLLGADMGSDEQVVRKTLSENQELRLQYLNELRSYVAESGDAPVVTRSAGPLAVFVSSTSFDLATHRAAVKDATRQAVLEQYRKPARGAPHGALVAGL